ncbi:Crp/Fnr family transcriptional regulator [Sphingobacterium olei]|uniref:Crp/Fnr family transcriptional regulator n=1 Tax=Sphingobacterium olei TaxID=2571155 RepID=A0A4U0NNT4_9SPHI|nr:Crp/Fnr family transcriptional regulator [Sphingobacterium olei]TJZ51744.1 Crp/Fnr family transcriptional regulator [Sphingobacterium olei]
MKKNKKSCDLKSCFMCRLALDDWKHSIDVNRKNIIFKKGEQIIREGDPVNGIYFVYNGKVKVHKKWGEKEIIIRFANNGDIIGHRGLGTQNATFPISATALETTTVCFIELDFFLSTLKVNTDLTYQLMLFFADELKESESKMLNLAHMMVKGRIILAILKLEEQFGTNEAGFIDINLSRQNLADIAGTTYETVFRILNELSLHNLIVTDGRAIRIKEHEELKKLIHGAL